MKKLITILTVLVLGLTAFAESALERDRAYMESHPEEKEVVREHNRKTLDEILKEDEEFQKKLDAEQLENNKFMLKVYEDSLRYVISETWELSDIRKADVTYSFRSVTLKGKRNKVIVNVVLNTVTVNGRSYKFDKDFEICKSAKKAHELNKVVSE